MNQQITNLDLFEFIGRQALEIDFLRKRAEQLQLMLEQMKKAADEVKNGAVPKEVEQIPT